MYKLSIQTTVFTASQADNVPSSSDADIHDIGSDDRFWPIADYCTANHTIVLMTASGP